MLRHDASRRETQEEKMKELNYIHLESVDSTNLYVSARAGEMPHGTVVYSDAQVAGRGQRGNKWESEDGCNVTLSMLLRPDRIHPSQQFLLSEISALAVVRTLDRYVEGTEVKWPNDIYYKDGKISGMLIEHSLSGGHINHTIVGIGVNVNQECFRSDAPNPVSLCQITGRKEDREEIVRAIAGHIESMLEVLPEKAAEIHGEFLSRLYRREGFHTYRAAVDSQPKTGATSLTAGQTFEGRIEAVALDGILTLGLADGSTHEFAFKEVEFIVPRNH